MNDFFTYIDGKRVYPGECVDLPGGALVNAEPERLQGPWGLPARIWWQGQALDIVAWPDASSDQRKAPHVLSYQLGRAINNTRLLACLKISQARRSKLREMGLWTIVRQPHTHIDHTFPIEKRAEARIIPLRWVPALLQKVHDNESAWNLASHIDAIFEHCETHLPPDGARARSEGPPNTASQHDTQAHSTDETQSQAQPPAHEGAALLALATEHIAAFLDVALRTRLRSIAKESMATHAHALRQFDERHHALAERITTQRQHIERLEGEVSQVRADLDRVLAALEAASQRPTAPTRGQP